MWSQLYIFNDQMKKGIYILLLKTSFILLFYILIEQRCKTEKNYNFADFENFTFTFSIHFQLSGYKIKCFNITYIINHYLWNIK